jgi:hypothetical protein
VEKKLFHDKLKLAPLAFVFSTDEWDDLSDHFGVTYAPEVQLFPVDNVRIDAGVFLCEGEGKNYLARIEDYDSLFLKARVSF